MSYSNNITQRPTQASSYPSSGSEDTVSSNFSSSQSEDSNTAAHLIRDLAKQNLPQNTSTDYNLRKRTRSLTSFSSSKQQKTTSNSTPSVQQALRSSYPKAQTASDQVASAQITQTTAFYQLIPSKKPPNLSLLEEKIFKMLEEQGPKKSNEFDSLSYSRSPILNALQTLHLRGIISRQREKGSQFFSYFIPLVDSSKTNDLPSSSVQTVQNEKTELITLDPYVPATQTTTKKEKSRGFSASQKLIIQILKEKGAKTLLEFQPLLVKPAGGSYSLAGIRGALKILQARKIIDMTRDKNCLYFIVEASKETSPSDSTQTTTTTDFKPLSDETESTAPLHSTQIPVLTEIAEYSVEEELLTNHSTQTTTTTDFNAFSEELEPVLFNLLEKISDSAFKALWLKDSQKWLTNKH